MEAPAFLRRGHAIISKFCPEQHKSNSGKMARQETWQMIIKEILRIKIYLQVGLIYNIFNIQNGL